VDAAENSGSSASDAIPSQDVAIVEEALKEAPTESETALVGPDPAVREDQSAPAPAECGTAARRSGYRW
jgi:hypothetical protein